MSKFNTILRRGLAILASSVLIGIILTLSLERFVNQYSNGTSVAHLNISGEKKTDINGLIILGATEYIEGYHIEVIFNNETFILSSDIVELDLSATINMIQNGNGSPFIFEVDEVLLESELNQVIDSSYINLVPISDISTSISRSLFDNEPFISIDIHRSIEDITVLWEDLNTFTYNPLENVNDIKNIPDIDIIIDANSRFSLIKSLRESFLNGTESSIIANGVNRIVLETDFTDFYRTNHKLPLLDKEDEYYIYDTYINLSQNKDFTFYNPRNFSYLIEVRNLGSVLQFKLKGIPFDEKYSLKITEDVIPFNTVEGDYDSPGKDGIIYTITRYYDRDGILALDTELYTNYYAPIDQVTS